MIKLRISDVCLNQGLFMFGRFISTIWDSTIFIIVVITSLLFYIVQVAYNMVISALLTLESSLQCWAVPVFTVCYFHYQFLCCIFYSRAVSILFLGLTRPGLTCQLTVTYVTTSQLPWAC